MEVKDAPTNATPSYPGRQFPAASYWVETGKQIASRFAGAAPATIWIVSLYQDSDETQLNFPSPGGTYPFVRFISVDQNESYLSQFDAEGFRVWLQVEPGPASVDTLIDLVLSRYKHHPCVAGFGVDVEWLDAKTNSGGRKLTDSAEVGRWERKVKSHNPSYTLFLKHYSTSWMPASRGDTDVARLRRKRQAAPHHVCAPADAVRPWSRPAEEASHFTS